MDWIANRSIADYTDGTIVFMLAPSDTLTVIPNLWVRLQGMNSSFVDMTHNTRLHVGNLAFINTTGSSVISSGGEITVDVAGGFLISTYAYAIELVGSDNTITNTGNIECQSAGMGAIASGGRTTVKNSSEIRADPNGNNVGIELHGGGNTIVNVNIRSNITAGAKAVSIVGGDNHIQNNGALKSWTDITIHLSGSTLGETNLIENAGNIVNNLRLEHNDLKAIAILSDGEAADTLINGVNGWGSIRGIVNLGGGNDILHNNASIYGSIFLESGDDYLLNKVGKTCHNDVDFGSGDDMLVNDGDILGDVSMGMGSDVVSNAGSVGGIIDLGDGSDDYDGASSVADSIVFGGSGDDALRGGSGSDKIYGGTGIDLIIGGAGNDIFVFNSSLGPANADRIEDFQSGDIVALDHTIFKGLQMGALNADAFLIGTEAQGLGPQVLYNPLTGTLLFDVDGTGDAAAAQFATLENLPSLAASQFIVI